jgi:comEA protein
MIKRSLYFIYDRLQITSAERNSVYILAALLFLLTASQPFVQLSAAIDESNYTSVFTVFEEHLIAAQINHNQTLSRYFPDSEIVSEPVDTKPVEEAFPNTEAVTVTTSETSEPTPSPEISDKKININTANVEELTALPGIGPAIAARIVEYREEFGPFETIEDITKVRGIGQARFEAIKDMITVKSE